MFGMQKAKPQETSLFSSTDQSAARRARAWLDAQLVRARREGIFGEEGELTPELAELLLSNNECNRPFKEGKIREIVSDINGGRYALNGETVIVSVEGALNDGQNRAEAVRRAGRSIKTLFAFGAKRDTRMTVDQGSARTPGDFLQMSGVKNANAVAHAARLLFLYESKHGITRAPEAQPTKQQIREVTEANPDLAVSVSICSGKRIGRTSIGLLTFCHFVLARKNRGKADEFIASLKSGANLAENSPIHVLRNRLLDEKIQSRLAGEEVRSELIIRAWNMWRRGETTTKLQVGSAFPMPRG